MGQATGKDNASATLSPLELPSSGEGLGEVRQSQQGKMVRKENRVDRREIDRLQWSRFKAAHIGYTHKEGGERRVKSIRS